MAMFWIILVPFKTDTFSELRSQIIYPSVGPAGEVILQPLYYMIWLPNGGTL